MQEVSTKMMDKTARHTTVDTNILEANREGGKDDSIREYGQDAAIVCSKCSRNLQSADGRYLESVMCIVRDTPGLEVRTRPLFRRGLRTYPQVLESAINAGPI